MDKDKGSGNFLAKMSEDAMAFIPTRSSLLSTKSVENFTAVEYRSYKKKNKGKASALVKDRIENQEDGSFNIKRARHEIIKFGMAGFDPQKKEEAKVQLAIRLGAKPPKNKYKNYKELLDEKKKAQTVAQSQLDFQQLGKNQIGKSTAKGKGYDRKRRKQKSDLLDSYGQVKIESKTKQSISV